MKTKSAKDKGRRCAAEVRDLLLKSKPIFPEDIVVTPSGVTGPDLLLSPAAQQHLPFVIECKNQEHISIWKALKQAENHKKCFDQEPLLFFKKNRTKLYVCLDAEFFIKNFRAK